ncbi:S24/S26 family peptidase [Sporolactobacillus shoreicorticis]|uniref:S24/S26 family peptidase n=1 Tax=Sporolactobacillus shoreicorticis TaxID=1923877 RepID=A0ABW5S6H5_9BACL|nr:S24/S26 family peptidase [Sporolactobacillus shoreicorticis]MCO7124225.1 S24/S26 family peptidase [Sporolactobacillus shoreicorticis]
MRTRPRSESQTAADPSRSRLCGSENEFFNDFISKIIHRNQLNADEWVLALKQQQVINRLATKMVKQVYDHKNQSVKGKKFDFYCSKKPAAEFDLNSETLSQVHKVLKNRGEILMNARGQSMFPYIQEGDSCLFCSYPSSMLRPGQIALYRTDSDQLIAHRYLGKEDGVSAKELYLFKGDSNFKADKPVHSEQIVGILTSVQTFDHSKRLSHKFHLYWSQTMLHLPILSWLLNMYLLIRLCCFVNLRAMPSDELTTRSGGMYCYDYKEI